ncbi:uncharacterized protein EI90DRAFT_3290235 [Cantharellus anzutake]|uniref:uncharacterized protein n=1 Tax=Cantharellus anzutake TaxID=1750568 RepID=UPI001908F6F8|nr:uncharacterized protein EI90DRAFT_3290235 [Cantharellus anzutake]KAF8329556.1 hypothetical protein EI90DRAFT_3290235 [Cantharellus anzutake]
MRSKRRTREPHQRYWGIDKNLIHLVSILVLGIAILIGLRYMNNSKLPATPKAPPPRQPTKLSKKLWEVFGSPRGKGLKATQNILAGQMILLEKPIIKLPSEPDRSAQAQLLFEKLSSLSDADRAEYFSLWNTVTGFPEDISQEQRLRGLALNIFESNAIRGSDRSAAVYKNAARINHSCRPNAVYHYRSDLGVLTIQAVEDIPTGEEILAPYFDASVRTREDRQKYLREAYSFDCQCEICSGNEAKVDESDRRRARLSNLTSVLVSWSDEKAEPEDAIAAIEEALRLLQEENYHASVGVWMANAATISAAHQDQDGVKHWARRAALQYIIETGRDSPEVAAMATILKEPNRTMSWGQRDARKLNIAEPMSPI